MPASNPLTRHTDPHQRCTCGWRRFRDTKASSEEIVQRYVFFDEGDGEGFGAVPMGTYFGSGSGGLWGLFEGTRRSCTLTVRCESCTRVRSQRTISSATVFGGYRNGQDFYVVASDIADAGCFSMEFRQGSFVLSASPSLVSLSPRPLVIADPPIGDPVFSPPAGAETANTLLKVTIPSAPVDGSYDAVLVNRCCGYEQVLGTLTLEVDVLILNPTDADLNGAPELWLQQNWEVSPPAAQPYSGSAKGIALDKCDAVIEYDARFGVTPDDPTFGFTLGGSGSSAEYVLSPGGVLQINTVGGGVNTIWEKTLSLATGVDAIYSYAHYLIEDAPTAPAAGEGFNFEGAYSIAADNLYRGVRWAWQGEQIYATDLDAASHTVWPGALDYRSTHWQRTAMAAAPGLSNLYTWHNQEFDDGLTVGNVAGAPLADEMRARFGDFAGTGVAGYLRNFVVSAPRRFMRAWFRGYATVANPVVRLYVTSDLDGSGETLARFLVRYGNDDPYTIPPNTAGQSFSFTSRNSIFEIPVQLSGLTPNEPFYFTVERDFDHADDRTRATCWLMHATVRGS